METFLLAASKLSVEEIHLQRLLDLEGEDNEEKIESAFYTKACVTFVSCWRFGSCKTQVALLYLINVL